jgi:hypothetical protein
VSMTKRDFVALADCVRELKPKFDPDCDRTAFGAASDLWDSIVKALAAFCGEQSYDFKRQLWLDYVNGVCGPNGGNCKEEPPRRKRETT